MNDDDQNNGFTEEDFDSNADKGREPEFVTGRKGTRLYSIAALVERIIQAFTLEHGETASILLESQAKADHLKLLRDTVDYVLAVESVQPSPQERAMLIRKAYSDLFGFGPLDQFFADNTITTISVKGLDQIAVRYGHEELEVTEALFDTPEQLAQVIRRLFVQADVHPDDEQPYIEFGLTIENRRVCISMMRPPVSIQTMLDIRMHPEELPSIKSFAVSDKSRQLLEAIMRSSHGVLVVGEPESGKTMLLSALLALADIEDVATVERAGELFVAEQAKRFVVRWSSNANVDENISFGQQIMNVVDAGYSFIVLDELRNDEPEALVPLLDRDSVQRVIATMRGPIEQKRLLPALGMLARRSDMHRAEEMVHRFYSRFPFVVTIQHTRDARLKVVSIAEMQLDDTEEYYQYVELMETNEDDLRLTENAPKRELSLPDDFWTIN